ncbi:GGDEF domain-containing protein [Ruminococcus sp.]|uniref:GGDEF domain-containing protein n=1 Tax=Ruminococcus sp. TaxID=41978 RepID=UPI0025E9F48E|nr:GGDEF domain-containing protein [Ruminococcus sp.]MBQ8964941.1 GGDEF domain-containing protein [Ruminococcus sp.]
MAEKRFNIGLVLSNITDVYSNCVARGAMKEAKKQNVDLIIFPGKYVGLEYRYLQIDARYEYQYNVLFDHAAAAGLDHLIVAIGTIAYAYDTSKKLEFMKKFNGNRVMLLSGNLEGYDFLIYDNATGIKEAIKALKEQGKKHIGMMVGQLNNTECSERYMAYRQGLEENGLEFKDSYIITSDISEECREEAFELLDRNPEMDAVLCVNDQMAMVMYDAVRAHGKRIGRDIAVVGFDDQPFAAELDPPLATVRADAVMLGARSVERVANILRGIEDNDSYVPTKFIPRQSGLASLEVYNAQDIDYSADEETLRASAYKMLTDKERDGEAIRNVVDLYIETVRWIRQKFIEQEADEQVLNSFLDMIDTYFAKDVFLPESVANIYGLVDNTFNWAKDKCSKVSRRYLEKIYAYYYKRISGEIMGNYRKQKNHFYDRTHLDNIFIRDTLMFDGNLKDSYSVILRRLSDIGAETAFLYTFTEPVEMRLGEVFPENTGWLFKSYAYGNNVHAVPVDEQKIQVKNAFDNKYLNIDRQHTLVATIIYSGENQYGMAMLEPASPDFFEELEMVTYQMSSAVRTIELLKSREKMLAELHSRNLALEATSREDELTHVLNRRGFYMAADELISKTESGRYVVCYADMDNLKLVNDNYGHKEGDFCIRLTATILKAALGENSFIGRVGGDEFVGIAPATEYCTAELVRERCRQLVEDFNSSMKKVYLFGMSTGAEEYIIDNSYDLQSAVNKADGLLYERKAHKRRTISRT